ncbi:MAG: hypothetical protein IT236_15520 [Bacteroidia bacterium]|nr:hypothetical protein [Bacteroidia bacterium]
MGKAWVGYLASVLVFFAGILMLVAKKYASGGLLIAVAIAGVVIKYKMNGKKY